MAPDFSLPDQHGKIFTLRDVIGQGIIILYFYPKDETPGCVAEACSFRDKMDDFTGYGAKIIGVSKDSVASHARFANHHKLNFTLLSDSRNEVRSLYGVEPTLFGLIPGRKTYLIDKQGIITHIFDYQLKAKQHVVKALETLTYE